MENLQEIDIIKEEESLLLIDEPLKSFCTVDYSLFNSNSTSENPNNNTSVTQTQSIRKKCGEIFITEHGFYLQFDCNYCSSTQNELQDLVKHLKDAHLISCSSRNSVTNKNVQSTDEENSDDNDSVIELMDLRDGTVTAVYDLTKTQRYDDESVLDTSQCGSETESETETEDHAISRCDGRRKKKQSNVSLNSELYCSACKKWFESISFVKKHLKECPKKKHFKKRSKKKQFNKTQSTINDVFERNPFAMFDKMTNNINSFVPNDKNNEDDTLNVTKTNSEFQKRSGVCGICGSIIYTKALFHIHMKQHIRETEQSKSINRNTSQSRDYNKQFTDHQSLYMHTKTDDEVKCSECGKPKSKKGRTRIYERSKSFICKGCTTAKSTSNNTNELLSPKKKGPLKKVCKFCDKKYKKAHNYETHLIKFHSNKFLSLDEF